eukprot:m.49384 g.49384  ORF g.49384 m.49384 type:complete len:304 (+) comp12073_c0_seq1:174-1085(+)
MAAFDPLLDIGGVVWFEHINLVVGPWAEARAFFVDLLGFGVDARRNPAEKEWGTQWVNLGQQQLHIGLSDRVDLPPQCVSGGVTLAVPDVQAVVARLPQARAALPGAPLPVTEQEGEAAAATATITGPWGTRWRLVAAAEPSGPLGPGIRKVCFLTPAGGAQAAAASYQQTYGCPVTAPKAGTAEVVVGPNCAFVFEDAPASMSAADVQARLDLQRGVHVAIYVAHFTQTYRTLSEAGLVRSNPRFLHTDRCDTLEEAAQCKQYRFYDLAPALAANSALGYELEHEVRSTWHPSFRLPLQNLP